MTDGEFLVKLNAESHIDELSEISKPAGNNTDTKNHSFAKDGFTYRDVYFKDFDNSYYKITLSIGNNNGVATVYNVGKIKTDKAPTGKITSRKVGQSPIALLSVNNSISENEPNVKYSVKEGTGEAEFNAKNLAGQLINDYGAKIQKNEVAADIDEIRSVLASDTSDGAPSEAASNAAWKLSERLAGKIADAVTLTDNDMYDTYSDLRAYLRKTPIKYYDDYKSETGQFEDFNELRRKYFGVLRLSNNGVGIDSVYKELSAMYPNFFNEETESTPAAQLEQILNVLDATSKKGRSLSGADYDTAVEDIAA